MTLLDPFRLVQHNRWVVGPSVIKDYCIALIDAVIAAAGAASIMTYLMLPFHIS